MFAFAFLFEYATNYWFLHLTKELPVQPSYSLIHMLHHDDYVGAPILDQDSWYFDDNNEAKICRKVPSTHLVRFCVLTILNVRHSRFGPTVIKARKLL